MSFGRVSVRLPLSPLLKQQKSNIRLQGITYAARMQSPAPVFASGVDQSTLEVLLGDLVKPTGQWDLSASGRGIERTYKFKTFKAAWSFMSRVADQCKLVRHHPEWSNVYNSVFIRWTTHNPPGLSNKDAEMAGYCDRVATKGETGDMNSTVRGQDAKQLSDLANKAGEESGDCCGKPEKEAAKQAEKKKIEKEEAEEGAQGSVAGIGGQPS